MLVDVNTRSVTKLRSLVITAFPEARPAGFSNTVSNPFARQFFLRKCSE